MLDWSYAPLLALKDVCSTVSRTLARSTGSCWSRLANSSVRSITAWSFTSRSGTSNASACASSRARASASFDGKWWYSEPRVSPVLARISLVLAAS